MLGQPGPTVEPQNRSFPLENIEGLVTPPNLFFVRDHFPEPELSVATWRLKIEGAVGRPIELGLADLLESPSKKLVAVLECAGNPSTGSAASNGVWEGVTFAALLGEAGVAGDAVAVLLEGADRGRLMQESPELPYCQIVPLEKCMGAESMIVFKLNDRFLSRSNGFPARALLPGWYGMDSVKWLERIVVLGPSDQAPNFQASGMNKLYNRVMRDPGGVVKITRVSEMQVRSAIAWPADNSRLAAGRYQIRGFAWTGASLVRSVSFSHDGGRQWMAAKLESQPRPFTWVRWNYLWSAEPGDHVLMSRARDDAGNEQPPVRDSARKDPYELNFCTPVRCSVR
jgi:DMSO/TMAO reductase YedYZ molybdopterin-dependent catalytic subunit